MGLRISRVCLAVSMLVQGTAWADKPADTVFLKDGGRVRGTIMVESPTAGVQVQLPNGSLHQVAAADVDHVEYGDENKGAPAPAAATPAPTGAPAMSDAPASAPGDPEQKKLTFGVGAMLGPAFGDLTGFRATAYAELQLKLSSRFSLGGRLGTLALLYSVPQKTQGYGIAGAGESYYLVQTEETTGQSVGLLASVDGAFAITPALSARLGVIAGFGVGGASASSCHSFSTGGAVLGVGGGLGYALGARHQLKLGLGLDALKLPAGRCDEIRAMQMDTTSSGRTGHIKDFTFNPLLDVAFYFR